MGSEGSAQDTEERVPRARKPARAARSLARACTRPFGYLAFVLALAALGAGAKLLGEDHELGFFAARLNAMIRRYPALTRRGVQVAWLVWLVLLAISLTPYDPVTTSLWDEVALVALAAYALGRRLLAGRRGAR